MNLQAFVSEFLTFLEKREERLLSWGFYNVCWTIEEVECAFNEESPTSLRNAWREFTESGYTLAGLILKMRQRNLVYRVPDTENTYRTRFAESVRLLVNLRQMFRQDDWATGPRLVSDIKMHITPRQYPRRDQVATNVWEQLRTRCKPSQEQLMRKCFFALADREGSPMNFSGFQLRAFERILGSYGSKGFSGSVVCAGTGSGKTKAFYIPAFLGMAPEMDQAPFTKIIAIYPRNVLLVDQLREAISEAEKIRPVLTDAGLRPIRFGALLGDTPFKSYFESVTPKKYHWKRRGNSGAIIPYLKSPVDGGRSELIWRDSDRKAGRTCLYREGATEPDVPDGILSLTREELMDSPPDILFLSLEMLNREMCNPKWEKTFGMRCTPERSPRLMLLDEVHAHEGLSGAQAAWVLRRWRHWARLKFLHVVGLSATLREAPQHLASVAGLSPSQVQEFRPRPGIGDVGEMEAEGAEYNIAVKGDPAAGASLLGTSIQAGMLLSRLNTPRNLGNSDPTEKIRPEEFFRKKVFGFSDNLDSVNRWFSDMSDAESIGPTHPLLASLRDIPTPGTPEGIRRRRIEEGQVWELPRLIGHNLQNPLTITRCSSQDPGADTNSDLIIATSSLEVGFDDPEVGIILHHKRPGSMSSFIQRKGRAGRTRGARPWTVVVLSDYGADRLAFHSAEQLFQPEVDALMLPTLNPFVLRVQLALYLVDWIGKRLGGNSSAFRYLVGPSDYQPDRTLQGQAKELLRGLLDQGTTWKEFERDAHQFLVFGSGLAKESARELLNSLLWHEPRPLLMEVVPTLLRKLEVDWAYAYPTIPGSKEDGGSKRPLPKYIPKATFTELEVGEGILELEPYRQTDREAETLPTSRLLFESCPGRVSKRFATIPGEPGYWHAYSDQLIQGANIAVVEMLFPQHTFLEAVNGVSVLQPDAVKVVHRPQTINDTSNGQWIWQTIARFQGDGELLPIRDVKPWQEVFTNAQAYLHSNAEWIELLRYAEESRFEMRRNKESVSGSLRLQRIADSGSLDRQAIGFRLRADGIRFSLDQEHLDSRPPISLSTLERFRPDYFKHVVSNSPDLIGLVNSFQAEWLAEMSLAMLTATALLKRLDMASAHALLAGKRPESAARVLDVIFQMRGVNTTGLEEEARLRTKLLEFWDDSVVRGILECLESVLWNQPDPDFFKWVQKRYAATLAQALRSAMVSLAPQVSEDELVLDILPRDDGGYDLTVTESSPGGLGQIETIVNEIKRQPRRFLDAIEHSLNHCAREQSSTDLLAVNRSVVCETSGQLSEAFSHARAATGFAALEEVKTELKVALQRRGFQVLRGLIVSIVTKLIRPGSGTQSDQLIHLLNRGWQRRSRSLGIAVPLRTFAYCCSRHRKVGSYLRDYFHHLGGEPPTDPQLFTQLQQLLLDTCEDSCSECLNQRGRYYDLGLPSRSLTRSWLKIDIQSITLSNHPDWQDRALEILRTEGRVRLLAGVSEQAVLAEALPKFFIEEINLESLRVPVSVARVEQAADCLSVVLHIPDFVYV